MEVSAFDSLILYVVLGFGMLAIPETPPFCVFNHSMTGRDLCNK